MSLKTEISNLIWHIESGVDVLYGDSALNFKKKSFENNEPDFLLNDNLKKSSSKNSLSLKDNFSSTLPTLNAIEEAKKLADGSDQLKILEKKIKSFNGLTLCHLANNTVFSDGNPHSPLMIIGEAPGADEDKFGKPFVGPAGKLLDKMLQAIERDRSNTYITNIVFWRPPGNRKPTDEEISICLPLVKKHISLVKPKILVLLGGIASQALLGVNEGIMRLRGKWHKLDVSGIENSLDVMPMYHPAFLLRQPSHKRDAWEDLKSIKKKLQKNINL